MTNTGTGTGTPTGTGVADDAPTWWERTVPWWHAAFAANLVVAAAVMLADGAPRGTLLPVALLAVDYAVVGVPALHYDRPRHAVGYLAVATVLLGITVYLQPNGMLLLLSLYPQCFAMLERFSRAVGAATVLTLSASIALAARDGWTNHAVLRAALTGVVNLTICLALGAFVVSILRESGRRAQLFAALSEAQQELADAHHEAGVVAERERLAREIHDTLAQGFTSVVVLARAIDARLTELRNVVGDQSGTLSDLRNKVGLLEETAQANLEEARALVSALPPAQLSAASLVEVVQRAVDRCAREADVAAQLSVRGLPRALPGARDVVLLRVVQEALANVVKHARASRVHVLLRYDDAGAALVVEDDGAGFEPGARTGYGLAGMRQRVEEVGGDFCVESVPGHGTRLRVTVP